MIRFGAHAFRWMGDWTAAEGDEAIARAADTVFADYRGRLVLESFSAINPDLAAATCLWRPPNQPPEVLAREGLAFLRAGARRAGLAA